MLATLNTSVAAEGCSGPSTSRSAHCHAVACTGSSGPDPWCASPRACTPALRAADDWSAFLLRTRAFLLVAARDSYASDWSSVVLHELPTVGRPPKVPNVIRPGSRVGGSNTTRNGRTRFAAVPDRWLGEAAGSPAVHPAFAAVDIARQGGRLTGLVLADAVAFRHGGREESTGALTDVAGWRGAAREEWAVRHCDPDVESPLESLGRLAFLNAGLPSALSNVWVGEYVPDPLAGGPREPGQRTDPAGPGFAVPDQDVAAGRGSGPARPGVRPAVTSGRLINSARKTAIQAQFRRVDQPTGSCERSGQVTNAPRRVRKSLRCVSLPTAVSCRSSHCFQSSWWAMSSVAWYSRSLVSTSARTVGSACFQM